MFHLTFDGKLSTALVPEAQQQHRVLDIGTGMGIWDIDFVDEHPASEVLARTAGSMMHTVIPSGQSALWTEKHSVMVLVPRSLLKSGVE